MSRPKATRAPLPPREKLRVEQRRHLRQKQRSESRPAKGAKEDAGESQRRARRRAMALRRKLAAGLPRPLRCAAATTGADALRVALSHAPVPSLALAGGLAVAIGLAAVIVWAKVGGGAERGVLGLIAVLAAAFFVARIALHLGYEHGKLTPAELSVLAEVVRVAWEGGPTLDVPLEAITRVDACDAPADTGAPGGKRPATASITREGGSAIRVHTTRARADQLAAAVEVARDDLAARRPVRIPPPPAPAEPPTPVPTAPALPPLPSEAALAALDRGGRSLEAWKKALRASFADAGYRRTPPLPPDALLDMVADARVTPERRIGAALAVSLRADDALTTRLRVASDAMETEALRVAVEHAAEGTLEESAIDEAVKRR